MADKRSRTSIPERIGGYEILGLIGSGGMGVVYRGRDTRLKRVVAIKQLTEGFRDNPGMMERFYSEAEKQASLDHRNIVVVYGAGDQDGDPYIVMQYVDGETLKERLNAGKRLELRLVLSVVEQVCLALAYAHRKGLIHRDVKPANIIVQPDGTAKLFDFGIARDDSRLDKTLTHTGIIVGTPAYMAPERFKGVAIDGRSDLFSAGVLLYELLTGISPFAAPEVPAVVAKVSSHHPPLPSTVLANCPQSLDAIVARALAKSPLDRYASGDDMARDLREAATDLTSGQIAELLNQAERLFEQRQFLSAQSALNQIFLLDSHHPAANRLKDQLATQITQKEKERKARELTRLAQQAADDREWDPALKFCDDALALVAGSATLIALRESILNGKQVQEKVSQFLLESSRCRKRGLLDDAILQVKMAHDLDPNNSQVLALYRELDQEAENLRLREELQSVMAAFHQHLDLRAFDDAALLLDRAKTIAPGDSEVLQAEEDLTMAASVDRRRTWVKRIEEKVALAATVDKLKAAQLDLAEAIAEFPNEPALYRLERGLGARIRLMESEQLERETLAKAALLAPDEALALVREVLLRLPGNLKLLQRQQELVERAERVRKDRILNQGLAQARQAIQEGLNGEARRILERLKAEGFVSREVNEFLEMVNTTDSEEPPQEELDRTYSQAKRLLEQGAYASAIQIVQRAIRENDQPVLRRLLDEAMQMQQATSQQTAGAMQNAERLLSLGMFAEAVAFLEEQPVGVQRLPEVDVAMRRAKLLQQGEEETFHLMGRCYAQLGEKEGVEEMKKMLIFDTIDDEQGSRAAAKTRFRDRCQEIYADKAAIIVSSAKKFLSDDDHQGAEELLQKAMPWIELAPPQAQDQLRTLFAEASGEKKLFGFRRGGRRS